MIIVTSNTDRLVEPGFDDFTIYGNGEVDMMVMGPKDAFYYARDVIKGRWVEAEEYIKWDPKWAFYYALDVIGDRWVEAEECIMRDSKCAYKYAYNVLKDRWVEGEEFIKRNPGCAYWYASDIIRDRWDISNRILGCSQYYLK